MSLKQQNLYKTIKQWKSEELSVILMSYIARRAKPNNSR